GDRQGAQRLRRDPRHPGGGWLSRVGQHRGRDERDGRDGRVARVPPPDDREVLPGSMRRGREKNRSTAFTEDTDSNPGKTFLLLWLRIGVLGESCGSSSSAFSTGNPAIARDGGRAWTRCASDWSGAGRSGPSTRRR